MPPPSPPKFPEEHGPPGAQAMDQAVRPKVRQSDCPTGELPNVGTSVANTTPMVKATLTHGVAIQALLQQFSHPRVRADLCNDRFGPNISSRLLPSLDLLRFSLFPRWTAGSLGDESLIFDDAADHLQRLMCKSDEIFPLGDESAENQLTYAEWYRTLDCIAMDRYWLRVQPKDRCTHIVRELEDVSTYEGDSDVTSAARVRVKKENNSRSSSKLKKALVPISRSVKSHADISVVDLCVSSTDAEESASAGEGEESESTISDVTATEIRQTTRLRKRVPQRRLREREVVTPPVYEMDGRVPFKDFLASFEKYFSRKFDGDAFDQTQELVKFLSGGLLEVYHIKGGRKLRYEKMKRELMRYYREQKIGGKSFWRQRLEEATPNAEELLDVYALRLQELAEMAYPGAPKDCARHLRVRFLNTIPPSITTKILDAERSQGATKIKNSTLSFSQIVRLAKKVQKNKSPNAIMWTAATTVERAQKSDAGTPQSQTLGGPPAAQGRSLSGSDAQGTFQARAGGSTSSSRVADRQSGSSSTNCSYCGRENHSREECWRASKSCLICGRGHNMVHCPRYNPNFNTRGTKPKIVELN